MTWILKCTESGSIPVKCVVLRGVQHGFGTGVGMEAEGWMDDAVVKNSARQEGEGGFVNEDKKDWKSHGIRDWYGLYGFFTWLWKDT